jgi:hypothetical protein
MNSLPWVITACLPTSLPLKEFSDAWSKMMCRQG